MGYFWRSYVSKVLVYVGFVRYIGLEGSWVIVQRFCT